MDNKDISEYERVKDIERRARASVEATLAVLSESLEELMLKNKEKRLTGPSTEPKIDEVAAMYQECIEKEKAKLEEKEGCYVILVEKNAELQNFVHLLTRALGSAEDDNANDVTSSSMYDDEPSSVVLRDRFMPTDSAFHRFRRYP